MATRAKVPFVDGLLACTVRRDIPAAEVHSMDIRASGLGGSWALDDTSVSVGLRGCTSAGVIAVVLGQGLVEARSVKHNPKVKE